jgi:phosphoglycolate phosphatase
MPVKFPIDVAAVAFDLDGTLVDTLPDLHEAANRTLADLGLAPARRDDVRDYVGDGVDRLVKRILTGDADGEPERGLFERARARFGEHYWNVLSCASRPFPGVPEALDAMRALGLRLACVTNKPGRFTLPLLEDVSLVSRLDLVVSGDTLSRRKPDPLPLAHCAKRFGVSRERLLMIGDSRNDTAAARAAGCPVFCVPYGYRGGMDVRELDCDAIVASVSAALELIRPVRS